MKKSILFSSILFCLLGFCSASDNFNNLPPCDAPTWPSTSNITASTATFSWSMASGAVSYSLQTRLPNGTWYDVPGGPFMSTSVTVGNFNPNTTYEWRVRSNCSGGIYSAWTWPVSFTTSGSSCSPPTWLSTANITQTTATWDWSPASGAMSYSIQWRLAGGTWYNLSGGPWTNTWVNVAGLEPGTAYEWRVRSNCVNGVTSAWSYSASFTTLGYSCSTPTWPSTSNITETSATLSWSAVSGANSYTVQTRLPNGTWYDVPGCPTTNTWVTVYGLNPSTTYEWRVRANCNGGQYSNWTYPVTFTTSGASCVAPNWLSTTNIGQTTATINWSPVSGAMSYSVQWRLAGGTWYNLAGGPWTSTWLNLTGFQPGTTYEWRVRSNCANWVNSPWSYAASFTTLGYSCSTPEWPSTSNITSTSATLSWSASPGAQSYTVQTRLPNGTWYDVPGGPFSNTWVTITGLTPGTTYEWRVRANCSNWQYSSWTYPITFTTTGGSCSTPTWPSTSNITSTSATLSWSAVSGALSYTVQTRLPNGTWYDVPGGPFSNTWVTVNGLTPNTTYEWRVRANCSNWQYSNWTYPITFTTTGGGSCSTPTWPSTSNITSTSATLSWSAVYGAQSYTVQTRLPNGTWYDVPGGPFTNTWVTVNGLTPNTTYEWRVRANCSNWLYSDWTYPITFTTMGGGSCSTPTWPSTSNITSTSATLSWSAVSGAQSYTVQTRLPNGTWYDVPGGPFTNIWVTVNGLTPNTTYEWRVRANCSNWLYSNWTSPITFTTSGGTYCYAPNWLYTTNITQTSAILDWSPVSGAISYSVQWRLAGGTWYDLSGGPWTNSWASISGLQPGTSYEWRVKSNCANWLMSEWSYTAWFTTLGYSCSTPTWPSTSNITETTATFNWTAVSGALSYTVQTRLPNGTWVDVPGSPTTNTWITVYGLSQNTTYEWRVRANCSNWQYSNWTYPVTFTTGGISCNAPTSLYTTSMGQNMVTLDWSDVSGALNYTVQMRPAGGIWANLEGGPFTNSWVIVGGLQTGTTYEWRVRTNCTNGLVSAWSYIASFTTLGGTSCNTPTWPSTSNITSTTATLSWSPVSGAQNYSVQTRLVNGTWYDVPGGPFTSTWVTVYNLNPNTTYEWRVRANCTNWQYSNWTYPVTFTTSGGSCYASSWLSTTNIGTTTATFNWSAVSGALSYSLQWRLAGGTWYNFAGGPWTNTWANVGGLTPGTAYEWRVRSNCAYGVTSDWSNPSAFTTQGGGSCNMPTWPSTSNITSTSATLSWSAASGALSYTVQIRIANGTWYDVAGGPFTNTWVNVSGLNQNTTYEWRVRSNCSNWQYSNWTAGVFFTTNGSVAGEDPVNLTGNNNTILVPDAGDQLESLESESEVEQSNNREVSSLFNIAPNPASDVLHVTYLKAEESIVTGIVLMDMSGKIMVRKDYDSSDINEFREELDVSGLVPGMYLIQLVTNSGILSEKVVIAR